MPAVNANTPNELPFAAVTVTDVVLLSPSGRSSYPNIKCKDMYKAYNRHSSLCIVPRSRKSIHGGRWWGTVADSSTQRVERVFPLWQLRLPAHLLQLQKTSKLQATMPPAILADSDDDGDDEVALDPRASADCRGSSGSEQVEGIETLDGANEQSTGSTGKFSII